MESKITNEVNYFNDLINIEEIKKLISEKNEEIINSIPSKLSHLDQIYNLHKNSGGKIFQIGKTEQDWANLAKKITDERINFKSFSIIEKEDKLVVYFI
ncbi:MAG: hypothetical protein EBR82_32785 [Caulobacteraceae bacterium]|nr:hypothetical protein [Caulobacteraceae bacterium]